MQLNNPSLSWRKVFTLSAAFLLALSISTACKKHENTLGSSAVTPESLLASGATDTFSLRTYSILDSAVRTDDAFYTLLGAVNDPKTGNFSSSFYSQFTFGTIPDLDDATSIVVDSVVLGLEYRGYYGTMEETTFEVYQLSDTLSSETAYYASSTKALGDNIIDPSNATQTPNPNGVTVIGDDTVKTQLRLHLDKEDFGTPFMEALRMGNSGFDSESNFKNQFFKGVHVKVTNPNPPSGMGAVLYFDLDYSKITFYYHIDNTSNPQYEFNLTAKNCVDFNHIEIDNSAAVDQVIADTVSGIEQFYAQAFRSRAVVEFASIGDLPKKSIIHQALLVLPISYQTYSPYRPSNDLSVAIHTSESDNTLYGLSGVAAEYDNVLKRYVINLRSYVQAVVNDQTINSGIYLAPKFYVSSADRVIFNGPNSSNKDKPKLIVSYTEY